MSKQNKFREIPSGSPLQDCINNCFFFVPTVFYENALDMHHEFCIVYDRTMQNDFLWTQRPQIIHPLKTEAMILAKQQFIVPLQPLQFGSGFVKLVNSTSSLGVTIDNKLSWHSQVDTVKASFSKKIGALRRMSYLPKSTLEEIYFKTIIPSITYGISVWGNCSQSLLNSLDHIHAHVCRIIYRLPSSQDSSSCFLQCNWLPISYLYKRHILLKMHQIFAGAAPSQILEMFSLSSIS